MPTSLVIQTSFLGDTVLTTPLLAQLARRGAVDVVTTPAAATLLAGHPAIRSLIAYDKRGADSGIGGLLRLAKRLREEAYDVAFLAQGSWRSSALAWLGGAKSRVGFSTSSGTLLYSRKVAYRDDLHHAARLLLLARPNGREPSREELRPSLFPSDTDRAAVDALLAKHGVTGDDRLIAMAPGSVWGTKRWPYYAELAPMLAREGIDAGARTRIVITGGAGDAELARAIVNAEPTAIDATGQLSLLASAELIGRCAAIITNDSAPLHLASAMNTPTVAIFGPTIPAFGFGPLATVSFVAGEDALPCRPCDRHGPQTCPLGHHKCMRDLSAEAIAALVRQALRAGQRTA